MIAKYMTAILAVGILSVTNAQIISKDGVAKDTVTGLMWQDDNDAVNSGKIWEDSKFYCDNLTIGEYNDWRLPNINELATLLDNSNESGLYIINGLQNVNTASFFYWSSSDYSNYNGSALIVNFENGFSEAHGKNLHSFVRCVRNKQLRFNDLLALVNQSKLKISDEVVKQLTIEAEYQAFEFAKSNKSINSYKNYLQEFPNGKNYLQAKQQIDSLTFDIASSQNSIAAYKKYLQQYSNGEHASSARSNIQYLESEAQFRALLQSKSPQIMYIEAGKQERNGSKSKATKLYEAIVDRFPTSDFAVRASDKLTGASRMEEAESNRRSQSRQECENNKRACIAGCGGYISGADDHNNNMWQCKNKCEQISCY